MIGQILETSYKNVEFRIYFNSSYTEPTDGRFKLEIDILQVEEYDKNFESIRDKGFKLIDEFLESSCVTWESLAGKLSKIADDCYDVDKFLLETLITKFVKDNPDKFN